MAVFYGALHHMIVIEGPDASGKSTLAQYLARKLNVPVQHSQGAEHYPGEMLKRLAHYDSLPPDTLYDRHPCVSDVIYATAFNRDITVPEYNISEFYEKEPFIIYCKPPPHPTHIVKPHDTPAHLASLELHGPRILELYHDWALENAQVIYRIGTPMHRMLHYVTDFNQDILDFHVKFDINYNGPPRQLPNDLSDFRIEFMVEELCEYVGAANVTKTLIHAALQKYHNKLDKQLDALVDLVYVALGTAHLHGFDFTAAWGRVHRANMTKQRATSAAQSSRNYIADVIKPPGFRPPDLGDLVLG